MKTIYGLDVTTQWKQILELYVLALAKEHHPDWHRCYYLYSNIKQHAFNVLSRCIRCNQSSYQWCRT